MPDAHSKQCAVGGSVYQVCSKCKVYCAEPKVSKKDKKIAQKRKIAQKGREKKIKKGKCHSKKCSKKGVN